MCLIFVVFFIQGLKGQVTVYVPPAAAFQYSFFDMAQIALDNTSGHVLSNCYADIICKDKAGNQVFDMKTSGMTLAPGNSFLGYGAITGAQVSGSGETFNILQQTGSFPTGVYSICVTIRNVGAQQPVGFYCGDVISSALGNLYLLSPEDEAIIETEYPTLNWMALNLKGKDLSVKYAVRVCLLQTSQTYSEAIVENPPLLYEQNLSTNSVTYPGSAPLLDTSQRYVWQVEADVNIGGHITKTYSEIWMFQFGKHAPGIDHKKKKKKTEVKQYAYLTKTLSGTIYSFGKHINFRYNNENRDSLLNYNVYEPGSSVPLIRCKDYPVVLKSGVNYISLPVPKDMQQKAGAGKQEVPLQYLLDVRNTRKEKWEMKFTVVSTKKKKKRNDEE